MAQRRWVGVMALAMSVPAAGASAEVLCTVRSIPTPNELVERAALILHVRADGYCRGSDAECRLLSDAVVTGANPEGAPPPASSSSVGVGVSGRINFAIVAVLKGPDVAGPVRIPGSLVQEDDYNDRPAPYTFVRPGGRSGNCFAFGYRAKGEYLVFLRPDQGVLVPYWAPLAPINEQVRGAQDPWVVWVRQQLKGK